MGFFNERPNANANFSKLMKSSVNVIFVSMLTPSERSILVRLLQYFYFTSLSFIHQHMFISNITFSHVALGTARDHPARAVCDGRVALLPRLRQASTSLPALRSVSCRSWTGSSWQCSMEPSLPLSFVWHRWTIPSGIVTKRTGFAIRRGRHRIYVCLCVRGTRY